MRARHGAHASFLVAGPIALVSGLLGGVLVAIQGNGIMHQGEAPARGKRLTSQSGYGLDSPESYKTALIYLTRLWRKRHGSRPLPHVRPRPEPQLSSVPSR